MGGWRPLTRGSEPPGSGRRPALRIVGRRRTEDRHGSLRSTVEWSYDLLEPDEGALFQVLAVFPGGFTLSMAEHMSGAAGLSPFEVVDVLAALVDKSLVVVESGEQSRYRYLDTLRTYALEVTPADRALAAGAALGHWA